jgi:hypothetical protein
MMKSAILFVKQVVIPRVIAEKKKIKKTIKRNNNKHPVNWHLCQGHYKKEIKQLEDDSYIE